MTTQDYYTFQGIPQGVSVTGGDAVPRVTTGYIHCDGCVTSDAVVRASAKAGYNTARSLRLCAACATELAARLTYHLKSKETT